MQPTIFKLAIVLLTLFLYPNAITQNNKKTSTLDSNKPVDKKIFADDTHIYKINVRAEKFLNIVIDPRSLKVKSTLFSLNAKKLLEIDDPIFFKFFLKYFSECDIKTVKAEINAK